VAMFDGPGGCSWATTAGNVWSASDGAEPHRVLATRERWAEVSLKARFCSRVHSTTRSPDGPWKATARCSSSRQTSGQLSGAMTLGRASCVGVRARGSRSRRAPGSGDSRW
jgi:hypothetical protein